MYKVFAIVLLAIVACAAAKPSGIVAAAAPLGYSAPLVASVPASAIISREYHGNGFAAPYVAAAAPYVASPYVASPYASPYVAAPYTAAYSSYSAPLVAAPAAYSAYPYVF